VRPAVGAEVVTEQDVRAAGRGTDAVTLARQDRAGSPARREGIGRATALRLGRLGARVAVNYLNSRDAARGRRRRKSARWGRRAVAIQADVRDAAQVAAMIDRVVRELGEVDILVNNAGIVRDGLAAVVERGG